MPLNLLAFCAASSRSSNGCIDIVFLFDLKRLIPGFVQYTMSSPGQILGAG